jgi:hypothetical protein
MPTPGSTQTAPPQRKVNRWELTRFNELNTRFDEIQSVLDTFSTEVEKVKTKYHSDGLKPAIDPFTGLTDTGFSILRSLAARDSEIDQRNERYTSLPEEQRDRCKLVISISRTNSRLT